jgi:anti-sigma regulatory factor (Ser/Thr protein kinase)
MLPPDEVRPGGRGVYLMKEIMDEVEYLRDGDTNCVRMKKYVRSPAET